MFFEKKEIKIKDVLLMENNPRYTFEEEDINFLEVSKKNHDQYLAYKNLIESEGNLEKLLNLINSFNKIGFDETIDVAPFILENDKLIVAEGNRRFFAMKLLSKEIKAINSLKNYVKNILYEFSKIDDNKREIEDFEKNRKKILDIINNKNNEKIKFDTKINANIYKFQEVLNKDLKEKNKELLEKIISRHSYSEGSLKKEWSRTKMFFELRTRFINILKNEIKKNKKTALDKTFEELEEIYNRKSSTMRSDIFNAFFVYTIIKLWLNERKNSKERENSIIKKINSSSIELSLSKIKDPSLKKSIRTYFNISKKDNESIINSEINYNFNYLKIGNENGCWEDISNLIMTAYWENCLNTRFFSICDKNEKWNNDVIKKYSNLFKISENEIKKQFLVIWKKMKI